MKKGELMTGQIVGFILLIVAFIILVWIFSSIAFPSQIDESVCHESVVLRATLGAVAGKTVIGDIVKGFSPLQCKTKKICLGGDCREFDGAKNVLNIKAGSIDDKRDIEKEIAQEMVNCWTMMGEGKVSIFSQGAAVSYGFEQTDATCVICSRIAINKEALSKDVKIDDIDVIDYMFRHKVPGREVSYYEFFSGDSTGVSVKDDIISKSVELEKSLAENLERDFKDEKNSKIKKEDLKIEDVVLNEDLDNAPEVAIVFMQVTSPDPKDIAKSSAYTLIGVGAGAQFMTLGLAGKAVSSAVGVVGGGIALTVGAVVGVIAIGTQTYNVYGNKQIVAGYCGDISLGETRGCSSVRAMPYNVENLKNYCGYIDSIA